MVNSMKIAIDLGHGVGSDRGAVGIVSEESIIDEVGAKVIAGLINLGHDVIAVRPSSASNVTDSLAQRVISSNQYGVDLYVSIHANAGGGHGSEVFTYNGKELGAARAVLNNLVDLGFTNRGIKSESLYVINHTQADAMLVEICFVDTASDVDLYNSVGSCAVANAIVNGLVGSDIKIESKEIEQEVVSTNTTCAFMSNLRKWQAAYNSAKDGSIGVDGYYGPETEEAISNSLIKEGSNNALVAWVQSMIGATSDGIFGPLTKEAVIAYQAENGLESDGIVGPITFKHMINDFNW